MRKTAVIKNCIVCNKEFKAYQYLIKKGQAKYCSLKCKGKDQKGRERLLPARNCLICNKSFYTEPNQIKTGGGKYCSSDCYHKSTKGKSTHNKGIPMSELQKRKVSESRRGKMTGKDNHSWKGGVTPKNHKIRTSTEFADWRKAVFERDNYVCQKTKERGGKLHPHHIQNFADYPELRFTVNNGITLSKKAHQEFHKIYGNKNNTMEQLKEFKQKKL